MITHSAIASPVFKLLETYVFDVSFLDDGYTIKVELYQDLVKTDQYRCLFWQKEAVEVGVYYSDGECIKKDSASHCIEVDWSAYLKGDYKLFVATSPQDALEKVFSDIREYIVHTSGSDD
jgi:hypothetical protein